MINLKDEISSFKKLIYNKQLQQFISIDQQFSGQGLTIQSLITQNNFIVGQLRKMETVFINNCKLNDKIYGKIMEHQLNLHDENAKLMALIANMQRKAQQNTLRSETIYTKTINQINYIKNLTIDTLESVKNQMDNKVDKSHFQAKIKKILQDYDEGGLQADDNDVEKQNAQNENKGDSQNLQSKQNSSFNTATRKKGKVGYDEFYNLINRLQQKQKIQVGQRQLIKSSLKENQEMMNNYIPKINKQTSQLFQINTSINKLQEKMKNLDIDTNFRLDSIKNQLDNKTSDKAWNEKFQDFYNKDLKSKFQSINKSLQTKQKQMNSFKQENNKIFQRLSQKDTSLESSISKNYSQLKQTNNQLNQVKTKIQTNYSSFIKKSSQIYMQIQLNDKNSRQMMQMNNKKINEQLNVIRQSIQNLKKEAEQSIMKIVSKRLQVQIKEMQGKIRHNYERLQNLKYDLGIACCQMKNVKEVLAKKANYSDIIINLENKVNREDLKQIQKTYQNQQHLLEKQLTKLHQSQQQIFASQKTSTNQSRVQGYNSARRLSLSRTKQNRTAFVPSVVKKSKKQIQFENMVVKQTDPSVQGIVQKRKIYSHISKRGAKNVRADNIEFSEFIL